MDKLKLAACGVNCAECGTYNKEHDIKAAESLVKWYRDYENPVILRSVFSR